MSTPRTRHQNQNQNSNTPSQPKQRNSIVSRIVIPILLCIGICIATPIINRNIPGILPKATVPLTIVGTIILIILLVVLYIRKQYLMLKNTYQNLEQGMQQQMMYQAQQQDFVEYPVGGQGYGQYPQGYGYPQQGYPQQNYNYQQNQNSSRQPRRTSFLGKMLKSMAVLFLIPMLLADGMMIFNAVNYKRIEETYDLVSASVTDVKSVETTHVDDDGDEYTTVSYRLSVSYEYNGETYSGSISNSSWANEGSKIQIYVNPENPSSIVSLKDNIYSSMAIMLGTTTPFIIVAIIILRVVKKRQLR